MRRSTKQFYQRRAISQNRLHAVQRFLGFPENRSISNGCPGLS